METFPGNEIHSIYFNFMLGYLKFSLEDPHSDAFIRRILSIIEHHIVTHSIPLDLLKKAIPMLYSKISELIGLRNQGTAFKLLLYNSKDIQPLWYAVGLHFINISAFLINPRIYKIEYGVIDQIHVEEDEKLNPFPLAEELNPNPNEEEKEKNIEEEVKLVKKKSETVRKKPVLGIILPIEDSQERKSSLDNIKKISTEANDDEIRQLVWPLTMNIIRDILSFNKNALTAIAPSLVEDVINKSQDLGINAINFIIKILIPSTEYSQTEQQNDLINLIDSGCTLFAPTFAHHNIQEKESLTKHCIYTLIEICSVTEEADSQRTELKQKIAILAVPYLINRCKAKLETFLNEETRNGLTPLPK